MPDTVLCVGSVTADIIVPAVDALPSPGTLKSVGSISEHVGGCASNAAIDLAKLGIPSSLVCRIGRDTFGDFVLDTVRRSGADVSGVLRDEAIGTTVSVVLVDSDGERRFLYYPGSTSAFTARDVPETLLDGCACVFIAGAMLLTQFDGAPCAALLRRAKEKGKMTVMDTAWDFEDIWMDKIRPSLPWLDYFLPSYDEAARLTGESDPPLMARSLHALGARHVAIKLGGEGAYLLPENGAGVYLPACDAGEVVDTTGAGDSFCAGFLCGLMQGWEPERCGRFANAVGAHCVTKVGASSGIRPMADILAFMEKQDKAVAGGIP